MSTTNNLCLYSFNGLGFSLRIVDSIVVWHYFSYLRTHK